MEHVARIPTEAPACRLPSEPQRRAAPEAGIGGAADRPRAEGRPLLLCLSHLRWGFVWQRPQHLLSRAAAGHRVVVVEEPVFGGQEAPRLALSPAPGGVEVAVPLLPESCEGAGAVAAQRHLLDAFLAGAGEGPRTFWYYTPMAFAFTRPRERDLVVFDAMDELSAFQGASPDMLAREAELIARADLVFTGGLSLHEAKRDRHPSVHAFPSSIDAAHFAAARRARPAATADRPVALGFFGVIDERLDLDLLAGIADLRPDWRLTMVGPVVKIDPATLPQRPNIA